MEYTLAKDITITDDHTQKAQDLASERGHAAASWVDYEDIQRILKGMDDGDPMIMDQLPSPLSGEYAGEPTLNSVLEDLGLPVYVDDTAMAYEDLIMEYEQAFHLAYEQELRDRLAA